MDEEIADDDNARVMRKVIRSFGPEIPRDQWPDLMQTAMVRCLEGYRDTYRQKFTTSLHRYTVWACSNFIRSRQRSRAVPMPPWDLPAPVNDRQEDLDHVRECIGMLSPPDRMLIEQHFLMGMTLKEIGRLNGYTAQAAMYHVHKAVGRLRRACFRA